MQSVNKLWKEMGKPVPFKEFVTLYNKEVDKTVSHYKNANGEDSTGTLSVKPQTQSSGFNGAPLFFVGVAAALAYITFKK